MLIYDFWAPTWLWWSNIGNLKLIPIKEDLGDVHFWLWDSVAVADRLQIFGLFKFNLQSANQFANWRKWAFELVYYTKSNFCITKQYFHIVKSCPKYYIFVMIFFSGPLPVEPDPGDWFFRFWGAKSHVGCHWNRLNNRHTNTHNLSKFQLIWTIFWKNYTKKSMNLANFLEFFGGGNL